MTNGVKFIRCRLTSTARAYWPDAYEHEDLIDVEQIAKLPEHLAHQGKVLTIEGRPWHVAEVFGAEGSP